MVKRTSKDADSETKPVKSAKTDKGARAKTKPQIEPEAAAAVPAPAGGSLKMKDLIDAVAKATGGRKAEVKTTVEATLAALGDTLGAGKSLAIPPLGKLRVVKAKGDVLTLKLRPVVARKVAGLALAEDGEDG